MSIRVATPADAADVQAIYAPIVKSSGISFEDTAPSVSDMARRIESTLQTHPWLVMEQGGDVIAYAYASAHRQRSAYRWSCEVSVYVGEAARRTGAASRLYAKLFDTLRALGFANALAGITLPNDPSVGFHEHMGFRPIGIYPKIGFKNGAWRDVGWWNLELQALGADPSGPLYFSENRQVFDVAE